MSEQNMSEQNLFEHISKNHILQALTKIDQEGFSARRKSTDYHLVYQNKCYPPKYVVSLASYMANNDFIPHDQFASGEKSACFNFLRSHGFDIHAHDEVKDIPSAKSVQTRIQRKYVNRFRRNELDDQLFEEYFEKYINHCLTSNWLSELEAYKFRFGRWLTERIDFETQTDEEILEIIKASQLEQFDPLTKERGINFVQVLVRYHDDFIRLEDVELLRKMIAGYLIEDWDLRKSDSTWPVFSVWAGLFIPERFKIIAKAELMQGFIKLYHLNHPITTEVRGFNLMNTYLSHLSMVMIERYENQLIRLVKSVFGENEDLQSSDIAWFVQDFMLYLNKYLPSYYWVNQGSQYDNELKNQCICADASSTQTHHKRLSELKSGDILIHYANQAIQAVSKVTAASETKSRPYLNDNEQALVVSTRYYPLDHPIAIEDIKKRFETDQSMLPKKYGPFNKNLGVVQSYCLLFNKPSFDLIFENSPFRSKNLSDMKFPLNNILFGPPGTGKTFNTINYAVAIVEGKTLEEIRAEERGDIKNRYNKYLEKGKIVFTTFHQSMSYEDFIEGIKPTLSPEEDNGGDIQYEIRDGIFKELVEISLGENAIQQKAADSLYVDKKYFKENINKISLGNSQSPEDNDIYKYCIENNCVALGWGENLDYTGASSKVEIRKIFESLEGYKSKKDFNVDAMYRFMIWMKKGQLVFIPNGNKKLRAIGVVDGDYQYNPEAPIRYSQFRPVKWLHVDLDIPIKSIYPKYFSQQSIYQIYGSEIDQSYFTNDGANKKEKDNYVLIIDEINRGNVSQIFGELITLIEDNKRLGRDEELKIKLPYSKEEFGVPANIHIIGTMNTADRSVEALDTALRRRFSFLEIPPDPKLIKTAGLSKGMIESFDLVELLTTINGRIEKLLDKDHMIGHSYFLSTSSLADFKAVFQNKIIPLLQEYFFGDFGKIGLVIGKGFFKPQVDNVGENFFADFNYDGTSQLVERKVYHLLDVEKMSDEAFGDALNMLMRKTN